WREQPTISDGAGQHAADQRAGRHQQAAGTLGQATAAAFQLVALLVDPCLGEADGPDLSAEAHGRRSGCVDACVLRRERWRRAAGRPQRSSRSRALRMAMMQATSVAAVTIDSDSSQPSPAACSRSTNSPASNRPPTPARAIAIIATSAARSSALPVSVSSLSTRSSSERPVAAADPATAATEPLRLLLLFR